MRIITAEQGSPAWLQARCGNLTASCFSDLMAKTKSGPSTSRKNLITKLAIERITGTPGESYCNDAMRRGTELEPVARAAYEFHRLVLVEEVGFALHSVLDYVGASVDGMVGDNGLVEIKCPSAQGKHADALRFGAHADEYRWQIQGQLWISDREWCDAASYDPRFPDGLQLAIKRVFRDEPAIAELERECISANIEINELVEEFKNLRIAA